jgi:N12 class adenine-specific DNA methylase
MAKSYDVFFLLSQKENEIRSSGKSWMDFLESSAYTSKYRFNDQVMIYANKPDARACASMDFWNTKYKRWVNKGAKGIPLLDVTDGGDYKIRYVFDVSDTHPTKHTSQDVHLFKFDEARHYEVLERLENHEGIFEGHTVDLQTRVFNLAAKRAAFYEGDMNADIIKLAHETYLEEFDDYNIELMSKLLLINSVAFQMMERMNVDPRSYFAAEDFKDITYYNAASLSSLIATTTSEISADFIADLSKEISLDKTRQKNVQVVMDNDLELVYNENKENKTNIASGISEGGNSDGCDHIGRDQVRSGERDLQPSNQSDIIRKDGRDIYHGERNVDSELTSTERDATGNWNLRSGEETIFRREQSSEVLSDDHRWNASDTSIGSRVSSATIAGNGNTENDEEARRGRDVEATRSNDMGGDDEQHQIFNRRDDLQGNRSYLEFSGQLTLFATEEQQIKIIEETVALESTVFSISQADIDDELIRGSGFQDGKKRIVEFFSNDPTKKEAIEFLKNEYGTGGHSGSHEEGKISYSSHDAKGIVLTIGNILKPDAQMTIGWPEVEKRIRFLIENDRYLSAKEKTTFFVITTIDPDMNPNHLFTDHMRELTPQLYDTDSTSAKDKMVQAIYFVPFRSNWSWYMVECDETTGDCFGLVAGFEPEWGYFNLKELQEVGAQRLVHFKPRTFEALKDTELKNQLTSEELSRAFSGELSFSTVSKEESKIPEKAIRETSGQVGQKFIQEKNDFRIINDDLGVGTNREKLLDNISAIRHLKTIESEGRLANKGEQVVLSKYVGWGGLSEVFDDASILTWARTGYTALKELLTDDEFRSARESTLNAHYTAPIIIRAMYDGLRQLGFKTGNILEPSCGTGNFMGMLPDDLCRSKFYGVELDDLTGRIAKQLYQTADITIDGFENTSLSDRFFDVAIGNVPFGDYKVNDKRYEKEKFLIHDFFFAKTLDKVRAGGLVAFITSKGTLDKKSDSVRKYISQRAELIGAVRLPNNAFKANAGTEVTSDIIFLKKRERPIDIDQDWIHLGEDENGILMNQYFIDHPEMALGKMAMESTRFGMASTCVPYKDIDLSELLSQAIKNLKGNISEIDIETELEKSDERLLADPTVRNYSYTIVDGDIYFRENSVMIKPAVNDGDVNRLKGLIKLRDATRELVRLQIDDYSDDEIKQGQADLNGLYDDFTRKYGSVNDKSNSKLFSDDVSYALLCSLENVDMESGKVTKADMFSKRTIKKRTVPEHVDRPIEALAISIAEKAKVDMDYMSKLTGMPEKVIFTDLRGIVFKNPTYVEGGYEEPYLNADEYLSGNVREKLAQAKLVSEKDPETYDVNINALEKILPKDLEATDIDVRLGATWIPEKDVERFIFEVLDTPGYAKWDIKVHYSSFSANWNIEGKSIDRDNIKANMTYGTERASAYKIIEDALNLKDTRVYDRVTDTDGNVKSELNKKETMLAGQKQDALKEAFKEWIWKEPGRRNRLVKLYNEKFNSIRPRTFDGSHISFEGMNPSIVLIEHQKNAIAHTLYGENALLAHAVGAGKSFEMIASAMESKRLGLCQKSLFVVPNHLTEQMGGEFLKLYPSANILVSTKKDFEPKNRKKFCGRIATGDYDAVIIGHSQFERIPMSVERQQAEMERQIDAVSNGIADLKASSGDNFSVKQLEKTKKSLSVKLKQLNDQSRKDDVVTFEELGVNRLIVDEAHNYKNLFLYTKMRNVAGIGQTEAMKSSDMFMKCRYIDEITRGKGIIFATGTPISNSMTELYTMQRYLQYGALKKQNLEHFDAWASTFGETTTAIELSPEGTGYRPKTRFSKFYNLPELMNMFKEVADIKTADMLDLPVPEAEFETVVIKPSEHQKDMVKSLSERADMVRAKLVEPSEDNMLKITNDGRKLALDQRLMNPMLPRAETGKVSACASNVFDLWHETHHKKSTQLVFCDLSTPNGNSAFNVYDDLKTLLMDKGIPKKEIAFIHDATDERQKDELFSKVRSGDVRVLVGSTLKMGAGTNVQDKLIATHDLDCPWKPSDLEQRAGRLIRQGNENKKVKVFRYVTENTFDSFLWQLVENKQRFISQIMTSISPVRSAEDADESALSYAEIKALATGNPLIKEKMNLDVQVSKLKMMQSNYLSNKYALEDKIMKQYPNEIIRLEDTISAYQVDIERVEKNTVKGIDGEKVFNGMCINNQDFGQLEKEDAGKVLLNACKKVNSGESKAIGSYRGFEMSLKYDSFFNQFDLTLKGEMNHTITLGSDVYGNIARIDHLLDNMTNRLEESKQKFEMIKNQLKSAEIEVKKPFDKEKELKEKVTRLSELDRQLNMLENEPLEVVSELDKAKDYIIDFIAKEYEENRKPFEFENLERIEIAYTTTEDEKHGIQAAIDLVNFAVNTYVDDTLVHTDSYGSLKELNDYALQHLDYGSLVYVDDVDIERIEKLTIDKDTDLDGVVDRYDSDFRDSDVMTNGDLDEKSNDKSGVERPSILGQLKKNQEKISEVVVQMKSKTDVDVCL